MNRIGLQQLSTSARNSPLGSEKALLEKFNATATKRAPDPLKVNNFKKYQPITPSPLASAINATSAASPFDVFCNQENTKENVETQMFECFSTSTQTTITVPNIQPTITEADLTSEKPTVNYLRVMADRLLTDLSDQLSKNERLAVELGDLDEKLRQIDDDMEILLDVLADIEEEQKEIGTAQI